MDRIGAIVGAVLVAGYFGWWIHALYDCSWLNLTTGLIGQPICVEPKNSPSNGRHGIEKSDIEAAIIKIPEYKIVSSIEGVCIRDARELLGFGDKIPEEALNRCKCFSEAFVKSLSPEELQLFLSKKLEFSVGEQKGFQAAKECDIQ